MMSKRCGDRWYASDYTAISYETVDRKKEENEEQKSEFVDTVIGVDADPGVHGMRKSSYGE